MSKLCNFIEIGKTGIEPNKTPNKYFNYFSIPDFDLNKTPSMTLGSEIESNKFLINSESLLISKLNPRKRRVWKVLINNAFKSISSTEFVNVILKSKNDLDYFYYKLQSDDIYSFLESIAIGSTNSHVRFRPERLYDIEVNIPSPPYQRKIARILTTIDNVIEKTESAITKYKLIKQGMMHDLFTRGIDAKTGKLRSTKEEAPHLYKKTELGWIPKEWKINKLESITSYVDYRGKTPPKSDRGIFLITAKNIKMGYIDYEISKEYIPITSFQLAMSRGLALIGDVVITTEAPLGNIAQIDIDGLALAQRVIKYQGKKQIITNDFLKYSLMSDYFQRLINSESTGSTVKGIKGSRLHKQKIIFPKQKNEQNMISNLLKFYERKIETEQKQLAKLQKLKQGLMQDLLTGKKEVEPDKEDYDE